ncbi:MAG: 2-dehydropantoate 2-reductase [Colwellia sp.]|nr:2-dehydropantoate 2-reductase [Colwellia sp.]
MNIVIVGQGAMGLLWYHHIQQLVTNNDNEIQLHLLPSKSLASSQSQQQYAQYTFTDRNNRQYQSKINYAKPQNIQAADIVMLCLKSYKVATALNEIAAHLNTKRNNNALIVLAHNGMGTLTELPQSIINKHNIYALLTTHGCLRTAPLTITHTGAGTTDIGLLSGISDLTEQQALSQLLNIALPTVTYHQKIKQKQWLKLAVNCVINPLTAINNIDNGQVNNVEYAATTVFLLKEIVAVANAEAVNLEQVDLEKKVQEVSEATAKNCSSMRCDVLAGRKTEIDYINGYIHRLGIKHGIATPENTKLWQAVKKLEVNS